MWQELLAFIAYHVKLVAVYVAVCLMLEVLWPKGDLMPIRHRMRAMAFTFLYAIFTGIIGVSLPRLFGDFLFDPLITIPGVAGILIAAAFGDFFYYWMHRAQHAIPALWRFHSVHHSIEKMGAGTGYQHFTQPALEAFLIAVPASLVVASEKVSILYFVLSCYGYYLHSSTRIHLGPLRHIFVDNRVHRIHHSNQSHHFDKNFGVFTTLWDRVFGTVYLPGNDEWPDTGLLGQREPRTLLDFLVPATQFSLKNSKDSNSNRRETGSSVALNVSSE